ncbi:MAG TPA: hypothetical protein VOB72_14245 [Candidatus Dormibacteraeota bacterium]|nr:hypothetical protein [Candidatus Dormibacteraeota bacterium]
MGRRLSCHVPLRGLVDHAAAYGATIGNVGPLLGAFQQGQSAVVLGSAAALLVASAYFSWSVAGGGTAYPRPAALLSPAVLPRLLRVALVVAAWQTLCSTGSHRSQELASPGTAITTRLALVQSGVPPQAAWTSLLRGGGGDRRRRRRWPGAAPRPVPRR